MANAYNKVVYGNDTLIDLTGDTATASDVLLNKSFHLASGQQGVGTLDPVDKLSVAPKESTTVPATRAYSVGDYMWLTSADPLDPSSTVEEFCRVISPIASGGNIRRSVDVAGTTIGEELAHDAVVIRSFFLMPNATSATISQVTMTSSSSVSVYIDDPEIILTGITSTSSSGTYTVVLTFANTSHISYRVNGYIEIRKGS